MVDSQLLQVSFDHEAPHQQQFSFGGHKETKSVENPSKKETKKAVTPMKKGQKDHRASESSLNTDAFSLSHHKNEPTGIISPRLQQLKKKRILPQLKKERPNLKKLRKANTENKGAVERFDARPLSRPSSNRSPAQLSHGFINTHYQTQSSSKNKRIPLTLVDILMDENISLLEESQEGRTGAPPPRRGGQRSNQLVRSMGVETKRASHQSRNRFYIGGPFTQGSQGDQTGGSERTCSIERQQRPSQRDLRSEGRYGFLNRKQSGNISMSQASYLQNAAKIKKQLRYNKSSQKNPLQSDDLIAYANLTEPELARTRETPQSELKTTPRALQSPSGELGLNRLDKRRGGGGGKTRQIRGGGGRGLDFQTMAYLANADRLKAGGQKFPKRQKFQGFLESQGMKPEIQMIGQQRVQGKFSSLEFDHYEGLESYLPIPMKPQPRSDRKVNVMRSPQPSLSKRSPSQTKYPGSRLLQIPGLSYGQEGKKKVYRDESGGNKKSCDGLGMKMLVFPWEMVEKGKRNTTQLRKEHSEKGSTTISYSLGSRGLRYEGASMNKAPQHSRMKLSSPSGMI